jgi:hypothetical protein
VASFDTVSAETKSVEGISVRVATPAALFRLKKNALGSLDRRDAELLRREFDPEDDWMAVQRFRTLEEMDAAPVVVPPGSAFDRFVRHCARYWAIAPRSYPRGVFRFRSLEEAQAAGVDGLIVVDVPPEADEELCLPAIKAGLNFIRLATPTTDEKRLPKVLANTSGFVYYVSITGITGAAAPDVSKVHTEVKRIKASTTLPVAVGFGVKTGDQAQAIAKGADAVVVGSAIVTAIENSLDEAGNATGNTVPAVLNLVKGLAAALRAR